MDNTPAKLTADPNRAGPWLALGIGLTAVLPALYQLLTGNGDPTRFLIMPGLLAFIWLVLLSQLRPASAWAVLLLGNGGLYLLRGLNASWDTPGLAPLGHLLLTLLGLLMMGWRRLHPRAYRAPVGLQRALLGLFLLGALLTGLFFHNGAPSARPNQSPAVASHD